MMKLIRKLRRDEEGATAIEYGLIAALISVAAIIAMTALGTSLKSMFNFISGKMTCAEAGTCTGTSSTSGSPPPATT